MQVQEESQRARLVVAIRSAHGAPVEGAEIELCRKNAGTRVLGRTDLSGRATADGLAPGSYELRVMRMPGDRPADERLVHLEDGGNLVSFALRAEPWLPSFGGGR